MGQQRRRRDRHVSILIKVGVLGTLVSIAAAFALGWMSIQATSRRIDEAYAAKANEVVALVAEQIERHPEDFVETDALLADLVRTQPSIQRIRVVRVADGRAGLWASSYATDVALSLPADLTTVPPGETLQAEVALDGTPSFLTAIGVRLPNDIRAIAVYASPAERTAALTLERTALTQAAIVVISVQLVAFLITTYFVVIRRIRRLERAAAAVAAGDLSMTDPSGDPIPGTTVRTFRVDDELDEVGREFDRMVRSLAERDRRQGSVVHLGRRALSGLELQPLFDEAVHEALLQLDGDIAILYEARDAVRFTVRAESGFPATHVDATVQGMESHPAQVLASGEPLWLETGPSQPLLDRLGAKAGIGVPIPGPEGEHWGVLAVYATSPATFDVEAGAFLEGVANVLASAVGQRTILERERETERRFRMVVENATELIGLIGRDGSVIYASPSFLPLLEVEPKELVGQDLVDLTHPSDVGRLGRAVVDVSMGGVVEEHDLRLRRESGGYLTVDATLAPITDEGASVAMLLFIAHDVTEQVRAQEERRQLLAALLSAQEEERTRIAGDIHDDPIQAMTAVGFRLAALRQLVDGPEADELLDKVSQSVSTAVERLRHLMFELRPPSLDQVGIAAALKEYVRKEASDEGISFSLVADLPAEPDPDTRAIVYRLAQEALINVRKHANASRVEVSVTASDGGVLTRISDDGRGFVPGARAESGHIGLPSMRERARLAGGWFRVESRPEDGTSVEFWIPGADP